MLKLTTSGESHGQALTAIIEGLPSNLIIDAGESVTVRAVIDGYVYYTDSDGTALYRINLGEEGDSVNVKTVVASGVKSDYLDLEFAGSRFVWFNTDDYSYVYYLDLSSADAESKMIGKMTDADAEQKAEAEEDAE